MNKFRKKPVVIEAVQYDGSNAEEITRWVEEGTGRFTPAATVDGGLVISTLEGQMHVSTGDFVIRGVQGEHYPCKPDIFADTYDPV